MRHGIFVTGASGFVGRALLPALHQTGRPVTILTRQAAPALTAEGVTIIEGDLLHPDTYRDSLRSCEVVIHLAAATGRATAQDHWRVNAEGTGVLIEACRQAGVERLLFVSTIATTFPDTAGYHYAEAKAHAEAAVAASGLRFTVVRPTIILGPGAPILKSLEALALLPVVVLPGTGRARVQPIHVGDVARCLVSIVERDRFDGDTYEIGGPDTVTMEALVQQIRIARTGRPGSVLHLPLGLLRLPLRMGERLGLGRFLPITAGQLSSFQFDGVVTHPVPRDVSPVHAIGLADMLGASAPQDLHRRAEAECRVFTRHLLRREPSPYVIGKYASACATHPALAPDGRYDDWLLAFAGRGTLRVRLADAYASVFHRRSALRKRLVMLLAILETSPGFHGAIDEVPAGSRPRMFARLAVAVSRSLLSLLVGTLVLLPVRAILALAPRGAR